MLVETLSYHLIDACVVNSLILYNSIAILSGWVLWLLAIMYCYLWR